MLARTKCSCVHDKCFMTSPNAKQSDAANEYLIPETTFERFTPPRLGIAHLLIWTAVTAMLLKLTLAIGHEQWVENYLKNAPQFARMARLGTGTIADMMLAAGLLGMGVIAVARIRGAKGRLQPGHWLLVAYTLKEVAQTVHDRGRELVERLAREDAIGRPDVTTVMLLAGTALLIRLAILVGPCLWAAFRSKGGWHWTAALCLLPAIALGNIVLTVVLSRILGPQSFAVSPSLLCFAASGLIVLMAVTVDLSKGKRRDWLHWTGAGIVGVQMLFGIGGLLLYLVVLGMS